MSPVEVFVILKEAKGPEIKAEGILTEQQLKEINETRDRLEQEGYNVL